MNTLFYSLLHSLTTFETVGLGIITFLCFRKKTPMSIHMGFVFAFAILSCISCVMAFTAINPIYSKICYFLYYSGNTLMLNALYFFIVKFSDIHYKTSSHKLCLLLTSADIITLFIITFTTGINTVEHIHYFGHTVSTVKGWHWYFNIHLILCYLYSLGIISLLIYKACSSPRHNRARYITILVIFLLLIIANGIVIILKSTFDFSIYCYGLAAFLIYIFCFKYNNRNYLLQTTQTIINSSERMIFLFDENHKCIWYNSRTKNFFHTQFDLQNHLDKQFASWRQSSSQFDEMEGTSEWTINFTEKENNKSIRMKVTKNYDNLNNYMGCFFVCEDVTEKLKQEKEQKRLANLDALTGLPKRDYFFANVKQTIRTKSNTQYLLVCSNIVDFKIYNSIFGEEAGNVILKQNAAYISDYIERYPICGRISGDMFALLIEENRFKEDPFINAMTLMENEFSNAFYHLRVQIGVYKIENLNESVTSMVEKAILAMKLAKNDFNKRICWYSPDSLNKNLDEKIILGKFEKSLANGEFKMFLQPQVTRENKVLGAEALVRWIDTDGNLLTPNKFIPVLEKTNMITKLDRYIWEEAAKQLERWKNLGREDLHISVNISIKDLYSEDLYEIFTDLVEKYNINPGNLNLEITETVFASDTQAVNELFQKLRAFGFRVELDDFGSGYSSLGLLKDISVDTLKIDMSFLHHSSELQETDKEKSWLILNEISHLAQILKMDTIVEGVEEKEQLDKLTDFGCEVFQGYFFAKPESVPAFEERIRLF